MMRAPAVIDLTLAVEWGVASRALEGQPVSGDLHAVAPTANGMLVAAVDGLGHGCEAAAAARLAAETLTTYADEPVQDIVLRCHEALRRTRGAVISIASFDARLGTMTWMGIGNIDGTLFRAAPDARPARETLLLRGGVVGYSLPKPRSATLPVAPGDTLVFATDGVDGRFRHGPMPGGCVHSLAGDILLRHGRASDDALVLVARYAGIVP
jgi:negative regulator of sigma-B (phosphoserine phosphatase)